MIMLGNFIDGFLVMMYDFLGFNYFGFNVLVFWIDSILVSFCRMFEDSDVVFEVLLGLNFYGNDYIFL